MHNKPHTEESKAKMSAARAGKPTKWGHLTHEEILSKWLTTTSSTRDLAAEYGCSDSTIKILIRKYTTKEQRAAAKIAKQSASLKGFKHKDGFGAVVSERTKGQKNPFYGQRHDPDFKERQSKRKKGVKLEESHRLAMSAAKQGVPIEEWEGYKTDDSKLARRTLEYKAWRKAVYERDNYTCRLCGKRGGALHPHHIKKFATHPELRFEVSNGVTLCAHPCHRNLNGKEEQHEHLFSN